MGIFEVDDFLLTALSIRDWHSQVTHTHPHTHIQTHIQRYNDYLLVIKVSLYALLNCVIKLVY